MPEMEAAESAWKLGAKVQALRLRTICYVHVGHKCDPCADHAFSIGCACYRVNAVRPYNPPMSPPLLSVGMCPAQGAVR